MLLIPRQFAQSSPTLMLECAVRCCPRRVAECSEPYRTDCPLTSLRILVSKLFSLAHHTSIPHRLALRLIRPPMSRPSAAERTQDSSSVTPSSIRHSSTSVPAICVLLLVGLPGSGKSTLARSLQPHWHWLDSDSAKLDDLLAAANKLLKHGQRVVIDRCNVSTDERIGIVAQLNKGASRVECVWFNVPEATCLTRVLSRRGHPTLTEAKMARKGKEYVKRMIGGFAQRLQSPTVSEGYRALHIVDSDESLLALFEHFSADLPADSRKSIALDDGSALQAATAVVEPMPPSTELSLAVPRSAIKKFPRTPHLFATGGSALSTDDLLLSPSQSGRFVGPKAAAVVVQEKVDGANLGFTLAADWSIAVQNRSHYVTAATHAQFSVLPQWIEQHRAELIDILSPPGRYTVRSHRHTRTYADSYAGSASLICTAALPSVVIS